MIFQLIVGELNKNVVIACNAPIKLPYDIAGNVSGKLIFLFAVFKKFANFFVQQILNLFLLSLSLQLIALCE